MVAITVLLAATAASMFLGFQSELGDSSPTMAVNHDFDIEDGSHVLWIGHAGGDTISPDAIRVVVNGEVRRLDDHSPLVEALHAAARTRWRLGVYAPEPHTDAVGRAAKHVLGIDSG